MSELTHAITNAPPEELQRFQHFWKQEAIKIIADELDQIAALVELPPGSGAVPILRRLEQIVHAHGCSNVIRLTALIPNEDYLDYMLRLERENRRLKTQLKKQSQKPPIVPRNPPMTPTLSLTLLNLREINRALQNIKQ